MVKVNVYFCPECSACLPISAEPDEGDICENCNCDIFDNDPLVGEFDENDAKQLKGDA